MNRLRSSIFIPAPEHYCSSAVINDDGSNRRMAFFSYSANTCRTRSGQGQLPSFQFFRESLCTLRNGTWSMRQIISSNRQMCFVEYLLQWGLQTGTPHCARVLEMYGSCLLLGKPFALVRAVLTSCCLSRFWLESCECSRKKTKAGDGTDDLSFKEEMT